MYWNTVIDTFYTRFDLYISVFVLYVLDATHYNEGL